MRLQLIRHGMTAGNTEKRYIGCTDEPLCAQGEVQLRENAAGGFYAKPGLLCSSPMLRCRQTCAVLFPQIPVHIVEDFRETDFGIFEGKNYVELTGNADYQAWLDTGCTAAMPGGESRTVFQQRCCAAFEALLGQHATDPELTLVVHGGVIMAVLEQYAEPKQEFYAYHIQNGDVLQYQWDGTFPIRLYKETKQNQERL